MSGTVGPRARRVRPLELRQRLGRHEWGAPSPFGPDGWTVDRLDGSARIIVTSAPAPAAGLDLTEWLHASMSRREGVPTYEDLVLLHRAVWGETGYAYQVFAPTQDHVNIHPNALHLWGRLDGARVLPDFGILGSI